MNISFCISRRVRNLREEKNISQQQLANQLGVSRQSIIAVEKGKFLPSLPLALRIAQIFNLDLEDLIEFTADRSIPPKSSKSTKLEEKMPRELMPWSPFREISSLHDTIDRIFEDGFAPMRIGLPTVSFPAVNIHETDKEVIIQADVPGIKEDELEIEVGEDSLTLKGERKTEKEVKEKDYFRREFSYGTFSRTVALPALVKSDNAQAELKDGTLTVSIPKIEEEKPKVTKIKVTKK
jgi:HSP20 family protein